MSEPIIAAGGVLVQRSKSLIAVVRLSKNKDWVLPKGKLNAGETPIAAAKREVCEETGYEVSVHEFLGKITYAAGARQKVVHFWRMEPLNKPVREPASDVRAVQWLSLEDALGQLSRSHERAFLEKVGPSLLVRGGAVKTKIPAARGATAAPGKKQAHKSAARPTNVATNLPSSPNDKSQPASFSDAKLRSQNVVRRIWRKIQGVFR